VKRGYRSSTNYDLGSVYRTIELLLGVGPMNVFDGNAAALYEVFTTTPDYTPYDHIPRKIPVRMNAMGAPLQAESNAMDLDHPDAAPLDRVLWKALKGEDAEPPWLRASKYRRTHVEGAADDD